MRLVCPNCGAQYEVPDGVIPEQGRDVQCSNCGNTWFQAHPDHDADLAEELGQEVPVDTPETQPEPAPEPEPELEPEPEPEPEPEFEDEPDTEDASDKASQPVRRELDPAIADLLREEAEFEARQRAAEAEADMQTQPELGLDTQDPAPVQDEPARRAEEARERMESRKGPQADEDPDPEDALEEAADDLDAHVSSRRELLPDIEEINSSLDAEVRKPARSDDHAPSGTEGIPTRRKSSGFSGGFLLGVLVIALLWSVHAFSAQIAAQVPPLAGPLESYTRTVDKGRDWLDGKVKSLLVKLDALAAASEE